MVEIAEEMMTMVTQVQYSERESERGGSRERLAPPSSSSESLGKHIITIMMMMMMMLRNWGSSCSRFATSSEERPEAAARTHQVLVCFAFFHRVGFELTSHHRQCLGPNRCTTATANTTVERRGAAQHNPNNNSTMVRSSSRQD